MEEKHYILGVHITDRVDRAGNVQKIFTEYGCSIKTRIGLHHVTDNVCSPNGLILLELIGDEARCNELRDKLGAIAGIDVKTMTFDHPK